MKKLVLMGAAIACTSFTFAQKIQEKNVPAPVKSAFEKKYPTVTKVEWEKEKDNYEAEFEVKDIEQSVVIDSQGNILETEVEISADALPTKAKEYISKNYPGKKIAEAARITDAKGVTTYEAEIKGKDLIFDSAGILLK